VRWDLYWIEFDCEIVSDNSVLEGHINWFNPGTFQRYIHTTIYWYYLIWNLQEVLTNSKWILICWKLKKQHVFVMTIILWSRTCFNISYSFNYLRREAILVNIENVMSQSWGLIHGQLMTISRHNLLIAYF
jgi:hypothetical protein